MSLSMHGMSSWMSEYAWISSTATPARNAASASPPTASEQARTSSGRRRLPPSRTPSRIAWPSPAGATRGTQWSSADSISASRSCIQASFSEVTLLTTPCPAAAATDLRSLAGPVLQLPVLEHLHLIFHRLQPAAAEREQLGPAPAAVEQAIQRHLAALHRLHQTIEFGDRVLVTGSRRWLGWRAGHVRRQSGANGRF